MTFGELPGVIIRPLTIHHDQRGFLCELFRDDELPAGFEPAMSYVSSTAAGITRGPHEHKHQTDCFCFVGPSTFRLYLWDNRPGAAHFRRRLTAEYGGENPAMVVVPPGIVHAYKNIGDSPGLVYNAPNRLYAGVDRKEAVDEVRWELDPQSPFVVEEQS